MSYDIAAIVTGRAVDMSPRKIIPETQAHGTFQQNAEFWVNLLSKTAPLPVIAAIMIYYGIEAGRWFGPNVLVPAVTVGTQTLKEVAETNRMMAATQQENGTRDARIEVALGKLVESMEDLVFQNKKMLQTIKDKTTPID